MIVSPSHCALPFPSAFPPACPFSLALPLPPPFVLPLPLPFPLPLRFVRPRRPRGWGALARGSSEHNLSQ